MARYFKFRTLAEIEAASQSLGLDLRFSDDLRPLFTPIQIGSLRVGNRFCIQPMEGCDGTPDGRPGELTVRRYQRFGAGGAKLIWGEAVAVVESGRANPRQLLLTEANWTDFARLVEVCRAAHRQACGDDADLLIGLQLTHSGRYSYRRPLIAVHDALLDPRTVIDHASGATVDANYPTLSDDELARLVEAYVAAARWAAAAGFQFVDIKQCHRYLLNELLSARTRPGRYGGSFENRTRLAREIITAIRAEVPGLMLAARLNVYDGLPFRKRPDEVGEPMPHTLPLANGWGIDRHDPTRPDLDEPARWIAQMRQLGVAMVNVSLGNPYAAPHYLRPFEYPPPDGYTAPEHPLVGVNRHVTLAGQLQAQMPEFPLVGSGYSYLQEFLPQAAAANLRDGRISLVGLGRAALAQPDMPRLLAETGRVDRKRVCRTFSYCTAMMRAKHNELGQFAAGCPPFDKTVYGPIWQEVQLGRRG